MRKKLSFSYLLSISELIMFNNKRKLFKRQDQKSDLYYVKLKFEYSSQGKIVLKLKFKELVEEFKKSLRIFCNLK